MSKIEKKLMFGA